MHIGTQPGETRLNWNMNFGAKTFLNADDGDGGFWGFIWVIDSRDPHAACPARYTTPEFSEFPPPIRVHSHGSDKKNREASREWQTVHKTSIPPACSILIECHSMTIPIVKDASDLSFGYIFDLTLHHYWVQIFMTCFPSRISSCLQCKGLRDERDKNKVCKEFNFLST